MYPEVSQEFLPFYIAYWIVIYVISIGFSVVNYIFMGKSMSAIARRRGIEKPWLAWVPVGNAWMLGCISDQYRYVAHGQEKNARGKLLKWSIVILAIAAFVCTFATVMAMMAMAGASEDTMLTMSMLVLVIAYGMIPLAIIYSVTYYKALYDLYRSCDPEKSLMFLLLSIFVSFPQPFFMYACRNKDLGMPPRQEPEQLSEVE